MKPKDQLIKKVKGLNTYTFRSNSLFGNRIDCISKSKAISTIKSFLKDYELIENRES